MYKDTVTIFNRYVDSMGNTMWFPHILTNVNFNSDKTVKNSYANYEGKYAAYLPYATDDKIHAAEEKLTKQLEKYESNSGFYLSIDDQGFLCLNAEVIVESLLGDHEHKFFTERICDLR